MSTFVSRSHGAAVLTRAFQLAGTYDYNHRVPGIEIGGVLTKVLLARTEREWKDISGGSGRRYPMTFSQ